MFILLTPKHYNIINGFQCLFFFDSVLSLETVGKVSGTRIGETTSNRLTDTGLNSGARQVTTSVTGLDPVLSSVRTLQDQDKYFYRTSLFTPSLNKHRFYRSS